MNEVDPEHTNKIPDTQLVIAPASAGTALFSTVLSGFGNLLIATGTYLKRQAAHAQAQKHNNQRHIDVIQLS